MTYTPVSWRTANDLAFMKNKWRGWEIRIRDSGQWTAARPGTLLTAESHDEMSRLLEAQPVSPVLPAGEETLLTPAEAARLRGVSERTVSRWAKDGRLTRHIDEYGHRRYAESEVNAVIPNAAGRKPSTRPGPQETPAPPGEAIRLGHIVAEAEAGMQPWLIVQGREIPLTRAVTTVGRGEGVHIRLDHPSVSVLHAELVRRGPYVYVADLGLSVSGTFVNGRSVGRRVLADRDVLVFGEVICTVRGAGSADLVRESGPSHLGVPELSRRERDVLNVLCRPALAAQAFVAPASTAEIAAELVVTPEAVKQHMLRLYRKFKIPPGNPARRVLLANAAIGYGLIRPGEHTGR